VLSIYEDRSGILWIGTDYGGMNKFDRKKLKFLHYKKEPNNSNSLSNNTIYSITETIDRGKKILWIGTQMGGLNKFERAENKYTHYQSDPHNPQNSLSDNNIRAIIEDQSGALWIGTNRGLNQFDRIKETITHYIFDPNTPNRNDVFSIYEDRSGCIWIGTYGGGLNMFDPKKKQFTHYSADPKNQNSLSDNYIWSIIEDHSGIIWIGTEYGGLNQFDRNKNQFIHYKADPDNPNTLSGNKILCIHEDHSGMLWLGTTNGLNKFDRVNKRFSHYLEVDGLPSSAIQSILEDEHDNFWIGTQKGLSKFDPRTNKFKNFKVSDGLQSSEFCVNACFRSQNGEMFFGGINGFNTFFPDSIKENSSIPSIVVNDFQIFNKSVPIGKEIDGRLILEKSITETKEINLSYKENVFSFEFASLLLDSPEENQYAYMMEGFDTGWNYTNASRRFVSYTNMSGGEYVFRVKGSNSDGVWNEAGVSIRVIITPPFWKTWLFYAICTIVLISAGAGTYRYKIYRVHVNERYLQKKVNERTLELAREVDEHQKAEEALQRERNILRTVIDNIPDAIYTKDLNCRKTLTNRADINNMSRKSEAEVLGKDDYELYPKEMAEGFIADDRSVVQTGKAIINKEENVVDGEGQKHFILTTKLPFRNEQNQIIGLIGIGRDITERKIAEVERERLIKELQDADADIKILSGLVPICSNCKKIRDDKGFWTQLEGYIQERSNAQFTHGMCPDCMQKLYPDYITKKEE
jgi:PAS domain S-box-containing protein